MSNYYHNGEVSEYHTMKDGNKIRISDMETFHLIHMIKKYKKMAADGFNVGRTLDVYFNEARKRKLDFIIN